MLKITLVKSTIKSTKGQIGTVKALGLGKIGTVVYQSESDVINGMINKVSHLISVETVENAEVSK